MVRGLAVVRRRQRAKAAIHGVGASGAGAVAGRCHRKVVALITEADGRVRAQPFAVIGLIN